MGVGVGWLGVGDVDVGCGKSDGSGANGLIYGVRDTRGQLTGSDMHSHRLTHRHLMAHRLQTQSQFPDIKYL